MKREFKRDLNNNYMILSNDNLKTMDDYRVRMLICNQIPFILKCNVRKFDGAAKYFYEITSKYPMNRMYEKRQIGKKELNNIVTSLLKVLNSSMEYLLNSNDFILDPEYIYMNIESNQVYFCCMPGYEVDICKSFNELTSFLLEKIDHSDKHAVAIAYELYRQTLKDNYCLKDILNSIAEDTVMEEYEKTEEFKQEDTSRSEDVRVEAQNKDEIKIEKKNQIIKPVYLLGAIGIFTVVVFIILYISNNLKLIKSIQIDNDFMLKIGGVTLIVFSLTAYVIYRKYELKQKAKKDDDNLIIVSEPNESESLYKEKKSDVSYKYDISNGYQSPKIPKEQRKYTSEPVNKEEWIDKGDQIGRKNQISRSAPLYSNERINSNLQAIRNEESIYSKVLQSKPLQSKPLQSRPLQSHDNAVAERNNFHMNQQNPQSETYGNTVLLAYRVVNNKLVALNDKYSSFELTGKSFLVGKMEEHVDGVIRDELISRIHAEIRKNDGKYYLTDLNSTNGTYHNERRLEANETVEILPEDMIRFATAEYVFR